MALQQSTTALIPLSVVNHPFSMALVKYSQAGLFLPEGENPQHE